MRTYRVVRVLLVLAAVLVLASPVAAEGRAVVGEGSKTGQPPQVCLPVGTALAVLTPATTVAETIPAAAPAGASGPRRLVVLEPSNVGACADFQGFWVGSAKGTAKATLTLYRVNDDGTLGEAVAHQTVDETKTGPAVLGQRLAAAIRIEQVGRQHFAAVLEVSAQLENGALVEGQKLRAFFDVEYRLPQKPGTITGCVVNADDRPIPGAHVVASPAGSRLVQLIALDAAAKPSGGGGDGRGARTGDNGCYVIEAPPGRYTVVAEASGYKAQWYHLKDKADDADVVEVTAAASTDGINFKLAARAQEQPPSPPARAFIRGTVFQADETTPIAHALVRSWVAPGRAGGRLLGEDGPSVRTGADGSYELEVPVGRWLVSAAAEDYLTEWWQERTTDGQADVIELPNAGDVKAPVDFTLTARPRITGRVTGANGPLKDAVVNAYARPNRAGGLAGETPTRVSARTGEDGRYVLFVSPGKWIVNATAETYLEQWWNNKTEADADVIDVAEGQTVSDVDFALTAKARLSGTVRGPTDPLKGATVTAYRKTALLGAPTGETPVHVAVKTGEDGTYVLYLAPGTWIVSAAAEWFTTAWYDGKTTDGTADEIVLAAGDARPGVDFGLDPIPHGLVTGKVFGADGQPIVKALVMGISRDRVVPGMTIEGPRVYTNEAGEYRLALAPGTYAIGAARPLGRDNEKPKWLWYLDHENLLDADWQALADGATLAGIDFMLP